MTVQIFTYVWILTHRAPGLNQECPKTVLHAVSPRWVCNASWALALDGKALSVERIMGQSYTYFPFLFFSSFWGTGLYDISTLC